MEITFDPAKDATNKRKHGCSLADAARFDWDTLIYEVDSRFDYGETRYRGLGYIGDRLHQVGFTFEGEAFRAISLRKANRREVRAYEQGNAST
ncbi:BrnT family toxin (plasmid) [Burkholderia vietnamiensis]|uniref:BrnT family toxin n=1 Tax=Burkholderia vietnamiensis (strain G4 / LMG 22486) TaxID=269482 RepID=A4JWG7_BURVG|nr:protein of unknown function DUF497 [Burkholderia vietnamiensis G4]MCB4349796.1 BrnT family toxin [Burkholderia vietnamiensis]